MKKIASLPKILFQFLVGGLLLAVCFFFLSSLCILPWIRDAFLYWLEHNMSQELYENFNFAGSPDFSLIFVATALFTTFVIIPCVVAMICIVMWALAFGEKINPPIEYNATYDQVSALAEKMDEMKKEMAKLHTTNSSLEQEIYDVRNQLDEMNKK